MDLSSYASRFPSLRFVLAEFETGWVAHFLQRFDHATYRTPKFAVDYLTMAPSEYFRRNFRVTFEDDEAGAASLRLASSHARYHVFFSGCG